MLWAWSTGAGIASYLCARLWISGGGTTIGLTEDEDARVLTCGCGGVGELGRGECAQHELPERAFPIIIQARL